ncbi:hypothetical protein MLD38_032553 [Melastoma candidum]|nr:hypothetical protein MLD38_032553 [Melastoma candidum]
MNHHPTYTESLAPRQRNASAPVDSGINNGEMLGQSPTLDNFGSFGLPSSQKNLPLLESKSSGELSRPLDLNPAQLAQLATLFGQQRQSGNLPNVSAVDVSSQRNMMIPSQNPTREPDNSAFQNSQMNSLPQFSTIQPLQQQQQKLNLPGPPPLPLPLPPPPPAPKEVQNGSRGSQQSATGGSSAADADAEADPQKRLQATLQLAAALLQQIQQGKGP